MNLILVDNDLHLKLAPLTLTRPVGGLRMGILTIANSWKEALGVCKYLLSNPDILNKEQEKLLNWWTNYILKLRNIIKNNLLI